MHYYILANKTAWISSGSNKTTGVTERDQNFGKDEIIEIKKFFYNNQLDYVTRGLIQFDFTDINKKISDGKMPPIGDTSKGSSSVHLRLYEAEGNTDLSSEYKLQAFPIKDSWDEGVGKFGESPKVTDGVSWTYRNNKPGASATSWLQGDGVSVSDGPTIVSESVPDATHILSESVQSFSYESPDVSLDVTSFAQHWATGHISNNGLMLKFSGSLSGSINEAGQKGQESGSTTFGQLKFFSSDTNTIYGPKLEFKWDDHKPCTGSNTGSLLSLDMSGSSDNYLYMKGLKESYKESDVVKFRVGARKRYIQKTFSESLSSHTGSFIAESSGSYSIVDIATGEIMVPFSAYTSMSCDSTSNYFKQDLNGFYPDRVYKILLKLKYDDGQEQVFDDNFEFKIKR